MKTGESKEPGQSKFKLYNSDHAIVVGASLAGMLTARVLAEHFTDVTVIERDFLPGDASPRPGVPQSRHIHALLPRGLQIVERLFPGLRQELQGYGAVPLDIGNDVAWLTPQGWGIQFESGIEALSFTRDLLDHTIRKRLSTITNVRIVDGCEVAGLLREPDRITGVRARHRSPLLTEKREEEMRSDLTVIAAGRHHAIANWFGEVGLERPQVTTINAHIGYASRICHSAKNTKFAWKAMIHQAAPPDSHRSGLVFPIEGDRWLVTLIGADRDYPPADEAGFLEFARNLRSPLLYEAIRDAEPITPIRCYRATENRQQHFDQIGDWPAELLVTGDAACAFNPVYGQGMTTAALEAELLSKLLRETRSARKLALSFQRKLVGITRGPWTLATSADLRFRSVEGARADFRTRIMHWYVDQVLRLGTASVWARRRFLEVQGMLKEASAILGADMISRVLFDMVRSKLAANPVQQSWNAMANASSEQ